MGRGGWRLRRRRPPLRRPSRARRSTTGGGALYQYVLYVPTMTPFNGLFFIAAGGSRGKGVSLLGALSSLEVPLEPHVWKEPFFFLPHGQGLCAPLVGCRTVRSCAQFSTVQYVLWTWIVCTEQPLAGASSDEDAGRLRRIAASCAHACRAPVPVRPPAPSLLVRPRVGAAGRAPRRGVPWGAGPAVRGCGSPCARRSLTGAELLQPPPVTAVGATAACSGWCVQYIHTSVPPPRPPPLTRRLPPHPAVGSSVSNPIPHPPHLLSLLGPPQPWVLPRPSHLRGHPPPVGGTPPVL